MWKIRKQISETTRTTLTTRTLWLKSIRKEEVRQDQVAQRDDQSPAPSVRGVGVVRVVSEICFLNFHECSYASLDFIFQVFLKHTYTPVQAVHS